MHRTAVEHVHLKRVQCEGLGLKHFFKVTMSGGSAAEEFLAPNSEY